MRTGQAARPSRRIPLALRELDRSLRAAGTKRRAVGEKAYLKSDLVFYGVAAPEIGRIARSYVAAHPALDRVRLRALVDAAWRTGVHDHRTVALAILGRRVELLEPRDVPWLLRLVEQSNTWAYVDWIAIALIGRLLERAPALRRRFLPRWAGDDNFWIRRTALLAQLRELKRGDGDWALFVRLSDPMLDEREFFIRKAIGWVLREVGKDHPARVYDYLRQRRARVSGLTLREGAKYLPRSQRRALGLAT